MEQTHWTHGLTPGQALDAFFDDSLWTDTNPEVDMSDDYARYRAANVNIAMQYQRDCTALAVVLSNAAHAEGLEQFAEAGRLYGIAKDYIERLASIPGVVAAERVLAA